MEIREVAQILREAERGHRAYAAGAPEHNPWDWYSAYLVARLHGDSAEAAADAAARYIETIRRTVRR